MIIAPPVAGLSPASIRRRRRGVRMRRLIAVNAAVPDRHQNDPFVSVPERGGG